MPDVQTHYLVTPVLSTTKGVGVVLSMSKHFRKSMITVNHGKERKLRRTAMRALQVQRRTMPSAGLASQKILPLSRFHARSEQRSRPWTPFDPARRRHPSIQIGINQIMRGIVSNTIDHKTAWLLLYSLQLSTSNLAKQRDVFPPPPPEEEEEEDDKRHKSLTANTPLESCATITPEPSRKRNTRKSSTSRIRASRDTPRCRCRTVWWTQRTRRKGQVIRIKRQKMWRHRAGNGGAAES